MFRQLSNFSRPITIQKRCPFSTEPRHIGSSVSDPAQVASTSEEKISLLDEEFFHANKKKIRNLTEKLKSARGQGFENFVKVEILKYWLDLFADFTFSIEKSGIPELLDQHISFFSTMKSVVQ